MLKQILKTILCELQNYKSPASSEKSEQEHEFVQHLQKQVETKINELHPKKSNFGAFLSHDAPPIYTCYICKVCRTTGVDLEGDPLCASCWNDSRKLLNFKNAL